MASADDYYYITNEVEKCEHKWSNEEASQTLFCFIQRCEKCNKIRRLKDK